MKLYKIAKAGNVIGEYDELTVRRYLEAGTLSPTDFGWTAGMSEWRQLQELGFGGMPSSIAFESPEAFRPDRAEAAAKRRPFAYSAWMVAAFLAPYLFGWRIIFDKTLGYSKGWKIFYAIWIPIVLAIATNAGGSGGGGRSHDRQDSGLRLTPEQKAAMYTLQANMRAALQEDFMAKDADKDGKLDRREFMSAGLLRNDSKESDFDRYDRNKDGYITFEEQTEK